MSTPTDEDDATVTTVHTHTTKDGVTSSLIQSDASDVSHQLRDDGSVLIRPIASNADSNGNGSSGNNSRNGSSNGGGRSRKIKVKQVVTFHPRLSHFDRSNESSQQDVFRGFYTLFWLVMLVFVVKTWLWNYTKSGSPFRFRFTTLIGKDGLVLALTDAVLVCSTFICVPFMQLIRDGWIRYHWKGAIIQHVFQTLFIATAIFWTFHRQWFWVQSGFLTLHTFTMVMKVHSYCSHNGYLSERARQLKSHTKSLDNLIDAAGGIDKVLREANIEKLKQSSYNSSSDKDETVIEDICENSKNNENETPMESSMSTSIRPPQRQMSFQRRRRISRNSISTILDPMMKSTTLPTDATTDTPKIEFKNSHAAITEGNIYSVLEYHPREDISDNAIIINDLKDILTSTGPGRVVWPKNISYYDFLDYLLIPTLVYELEYPRTDTVRPLYVLEKTLATFGTLSLVLIITEHYIYPAIQNSTGQSILVFWLDLVPPFLLNLLLIFFIIFECVCNGFAELTRFADRNFYDDWWNSSNFEDFAKKWNRPVHNFLLRHVYTSTMMTYPISKLQASFLTFFLSACVHELLMAVVTKKIRLYLFAMQMTQLPLIMISRVKIVRQYPTIGNIFFWLGLISGFPLLAVAYWRW